VHRPTDVHTIRPHYTNREITKALFCIASCTSEILSLYQIIVHFSIHNRKTENSRRLKPSKIRHMSSDIDYSDDLSLISDGRSPSGLKRRK
jgi:hypothetical protein